MPVPAIGANNQLGETVAGQKSILAGGITDVGNPANAALKTNPATMVNANNTTPKSGRYDFGVTSCSDIILTLQRIMHKLMLQNSMPIIQLLKLY